MALLGTPNGVGLSYFLSTHKSWFGEKVPQAIKVFSSVEPGKGEPWYNMLFFVDVKPNDDGEWVYD